MQNTHSYYVRFPQGALTLSSISTIGTRASDSSLKLPKYHGQFWAPRITSSSRLRNWQPKPIPESVVFLEAKILIDETSQRAEGAFRPRQKPLDYQINPASRSIATYQISGQVPVY